MFVIACGLFIECEAAQELQQSSAEAGVVHVDDSCSVAGRALIGASSTSAVCDWGQR